MNLNVKLEGEEEQGIQYMNRFAINIPSTAFNLNIVNSGLNNQGYIINPVNTSSQNIVTYQPSMALQSYFALPTESEGNIIQSLPVGVPVPVGLPVQTGFLQNPNFVNTSIIIGSEDCNSSEIVSASTSNINNVEEIKSSFFQKPLNICNSTEAHDIGINCSSSSDSSIKKPCPLEMSIKAANIDIEFEKCEQEISISAENSNFKLFEDKLMSNIELKNKSYKPVVTSPIHKSSEISLVGETNINNLNSEIIWHKGSTKSDPSNNFQENTVCDAEESNVNGDKSDYNKTTEYQRCEENEENMPCDQFESDSSSGASDSLPLSIALKLEKISVPEKKNYSITKGRKETENYAFNGKINDKDKITGKRSRKPKVAEYDEVWSESDDDILNLKRIKNEFEYKCFFDPKISGDIKNEKFLRVRSCCSKKECSKKISIQHQMAAHKNFLSLKSDAERNLYLLNCIEHVPKAKHVSNKNLEEENDKNKGKLEKNINVVSANMQIEIENESNGNQKVSDEIQNAINESLKECILINHKEENKDYNNVAVESTFSDKEEKNNWNYYIKFDDCKKKVCLQFLLKLLRITKTTVKQLQKQILSGTPLINEENNTKTNQRVQDVWDMAKFHLESLSSEDFLNCSAVPPHKFLFKKFSKENLFANFKEFYWEKCGKKVDIKFSAYKRFLSKETSISFLQKNLNNCAECEELKARKKQNRYIKNTFKSKKLKFSDNCETQKNNIRERSGFNNKHEKNSNSLKLIISQKSKSCSSKVLQSQGTRNIRNKDLSRRNKSKLCKERPKKSITKGRDVWSLMLLHLETMPYKECKSCTNTKRHRFLDSTFTTQGLFEDYRKYFLKETNSELGLGFTMYEKYFNRNCNYTIMDVNLDGTECPRCVADNSKS